MGIYTLKSKNALQRKFGDLVTNNIFVIVATLIITFFIWAVKKCRRCPAEAPLFSQKYNATDTADILRKT